MTPVFFFIFQPQPIYNVITNISITMATVYVPDEVISKVLVARKDKQRFVREAIEEKIEREWGD